MEVQIRGFIHEGGESLSWLQRARGAVSGGLAQSGGGWRKPERSGCGLRDVGKALCEQTWGLLWPSRGAAAAALSGACLGAGREASCFQLFENQNPTEI